MIINNLAYLEPIEAANAIIGGDDDDKEEDDDNGEGTVKVVNNYYNYIFAPTYAPTFIHVSVPYIPFPKFSKAPKLPKNDYWGYAL